jgi:hypothetical protein
MVRGLTNMFVSLCLQMIDVLTFFLVRNKRYNSSVRCYCIR